MKRHSADEIASKLRQAEELIAGGRSQAQACKALGVSVMTYHRWRKAHPSHDRDGLAAAERPVVATEPTTNADQARIKELRLENDRLRRIVTDLLLEKVKIEEQIAVNVGRKTVNRN
jgi:putative transposase